ncbi:MAG: DUF2809 domain-containing protein [Paludibacteraceae bacterium]|nr:DUF2809 domain-containing protein [Paludibacteraceae bacterium]
MTTDQRRRITYILLFVAIFVTETLIALFVHDSIIRPFIGDVIVEWLIYCFVRIFFLYKFRWLPHYVFLFSVGIELLQYIKLINILGLQDNAVMRAILGTSFSWIDIYSMLCDRLYHDYHRTKNLFIQKVIFYQI